MNVLKLFVLFSLAIAGGVITTKTAESLDCIAPEWTAESLSKYEAIFIGTVQAREHPKEDISYLKTNELYSVLVEKPWKGAQADETITVRRYAGWGDELVVTARYLFALEKDEGTPYTAHICGLTSPVAYADEGINFLNEYFGVNKK